MEPRATDVFGIATKVSNYTYVDRGDLDALIARQLDRATHLAVRGESKVGKSWLRQRVIPNALVVQCRLSMTTLDVYSEALGKLGIRLETTSISEKEYRVSASAETEGGLGILARVKASVSAAFEKTEAKSTVPIGQGVEVLSFVADVLSASGRRLVIEDFHYLSTEQQQALAYDLKSLWDMEVFVVLIGVWSKDNLLLYLNRDLAGRVYEVSVSWSAEDLLEVLRAGEAALNIRFSEEMVGEAVRDSYGNVGTLQQLALFTLDEAGVGERVEATTRIEDIPQYTTAAMAYAGQLEPIYIQFAERVSKGIRRRRNGTAIYAHALATLLAQEDAALAEGVPVDDIYAIAVSRQPRIQKGNLKTALGKIQGLQVDGEGRGLVLAYDDYRERVTVADKQLLFFRKYMTVHWPWRELIEWADSSAVEGAYEADGDDL